jgi:hypothetical protein
VVPPDNEVFVSIYCLTCLLFEKSNFVINGMFISFLINILCFEYIYNKKEFMKTIKKKDLTELVGGDMYSSGGDKTFNSNSEIETGPVQKPFDDNSNYEKGMSTTSDRVFGRYRQNIPWFAVYSYGGTRAAGGLKTFESVTVTKKSVEEKIEDLVKKSKVSDVTEKDYNPKVAKIIDTINDAELTEKQLEDLKKAIHDKQKTKNI